MKIKKWAFKTWGGGTNEKAVGKGILAACGLGKTYKTEDGNYSLPLVLQEVKLAESLDFKTCNLETDLKLYPEIKFNPETEVCTEDSNDNGLFESTCNGDSGGPLYPLNDQNKPVCLYGLTSNGDEYCRIQSGIFTRVSAYADWIKKNMEIMSG